jgi:phage terminase small subunit
MTDKSKKPANIPKLPRLSRKQIREGLDSIPMDAILLGVGKSKELTHKQKQFARNVALGKTKADAYREAYNSKGTPNTIGTEVSRLSQNPRIAQEIEAYRLAKEAEDYRNPADLRRLVIHQLTQHALDGEINPAQRIKSLELLGKVAGVDVFMDRKETTVIHQSGDIKARLLNQLKAVIDVESRDISTEGTAESLIAELTAPQQADGFSGETDREPGGPTTGVSPLIGPCAEGSAIHSIPHNQSDSNSTDSVPCKDSHPQDVDFTEEKKEVVTLPVDEGVGADDFWAEKGLDIEEDPPVGDWK